MSVEVPRPQRIVERVGVRASFLWGLSEATLFFFVPDIPVGAVALFSWRRGLRAAAAAVGGAVVGGVLLYTATRAIGSGVLDVLDRLPAIPDSFFTHVRESVARDGGVAIILGPSGGIPYKLYAAEWAVAGRDVITLALWTVPARAARIVPVALLSSLGGALWRRRFGRERTGLLLIIYLALWAVIYAAYFARVGW